MAGAPTPRPSLTRDRVIEAALGLVDREGLDRLTMRRVATELGVATMSLYNHVADKHALLEALAERVLPSVDLSTSTTWSEAARQWAAQVRAALQARSPAIGLILSGEFPRPMLRTVLETSTVLRQRGLSEDEGRLVMRSVARFMAGSLLLDAMATRSRRPGRDREGLDQAFEVGLDALLDGLQARIQARPVGGGST